MFKIRTSKPTSSDKFVKFYKTTATGGLSACINGSPTDSVCTVLANCVGYSCSRFNEIYAELTGTTAMKYPYLNCNAENFVERAKQTYGLSTGSTPKPGAIMVWQKGATLSGNDGAGHVAIVEKVIDANTVYTSESGYGGSAFWNSTRSKGTGNWGINSPYKFRCFIYNPAVTDAMIAEENKKAENENPYVEPSVVMNQATYKNKSFSGVKWAQWYLTKYKYYTDKIDGYFGPLTFNAVKAFQANHNDQSGKALEVDGSIGPLTRWSLANESKCKRSTPTQATETKTMKVGSVVKITGNKYYSGQTIPAWVKKKNWIVYEISGDRVVINKSQDGSSGIMSPIKKSDLQVV